MATILLLKTASINKAINTNETPVKEKHVRVAIIGTYQDKSSEFFWCVVRRMALQGHPIVCWKFLSVVHKLLRDGHHHCLKETHKYNTLILELGKLWGHLKDGYGRLIAFYSKLILQKLAFHKKNPLIPGNLMLGEGKLDKICSNDINSYFELSVDMLDYMDDILALQTAVFGSLDMSRSNSMTSTGQCRLAPLIMCILDSCQLYDYIVQILFKLHSSLPADTLTGHRDRFYHQYKSLKQFYHSSGNLQYFKNLIKVPSLPAEPPNFLIASDLSSHVAPVAVVPEPEPDDTPDEILVDTSSVMSEEPPQMDMWAQDNGAPSPPMPDEKDFLIERLLKEINDLKLELSRTKQRLDHLHAEDMMMKESLENRIRELESELDELKQIAQSTTEESEALKTALKESETNSDAATKASAMEAVARANEDKFKKMKDIYTKLRSEHVNLLRTLSDLKKQVHTETKAKGDAEEKVKSIEQDMKELKQEKSKAEESVQQSASDTATRLQEATLLRQQVEQDKKGLEEQLAQLKKKKVPTATLR